MLRTAVSLTLGTINRVSNIRNIANYPTEAESEEQITITDDGKVIVCWHPEKAFPYECSKSLPPPEMPSNSIFKMESKEEMYKMFYKKKPEQEREELMKITHTAKYHWSKRASFYKRKKTPPQRPYL